MIKEQKIHSKFRIINLQGGDSDENVLAELAEYSIKNDLANDGYAEALISRERQYPTGLNTTAYGIAIPHADQEFTKEGSLVMAILDKPTLFKEMGTLNDVNVEVIFLLLVSEMENQVKVLKSIVELIQDDNKLKKLKGPEALSLLEDEFKNLV